MRTLPRALPRGSESRRRERDGRVQQHQRRARQRKCVHPAREVLRKEWGFDGVVVSDYNSVLELIANGFAADESDAAEKGITGGVDMEWLARFISDTPPS